MDQTLLALNATHIAGIAIDCLDSETCNSPLMSHRSVIATQHLAVATEVAQKCIAKVVAENILRIVNGEIPLDTVEPSNTSTTP